MPKIFIFSLVAIFLSESALFSKTINIDLITQNSHKTPLIYLHRTGCSYCNAMEEFTFDDDMVKEYLDKNYIFISINVSLNDRIIYKGKESSGKHFAKKIGYTFYPAVLFLDKNEKILYVSLGYKEESDFLIILKHVHQGKHKKSSFKSIN